MPKEAMKCPTYLYHPEHDPRLFDADSCDMEALEADGWVDSPEKLVEVEQGDPVDDDVVGRFLANPADFTVDQMSKLAKDKGIEVPSGLKRAGIVDFLTEELIHDHD